MDLTDAERKAILWHLGRYTHDWKEQSNYKYKTSVNLNCMGEGFFSSVVPVVLERARDGESQLTYALYVDGKRVWGELELVSDLATQVFECSVRY